MHILDKFEILWEKGGVVVRDGLVLAWSVKVPIRMIFEVMPLEVVVAASAFTPNGTK